MLAVALAALVGFAGLATEAGSWRLARRAAATAADFAALAGAAAKNRGADPIAAALDAASRNGFADGAGGTRVVVAAPPTSGIRAGSPTAVEVIVSRPQSLGFARLFLGAAPTVQARAVAAANTDEEVCILALGGGLEIGGNATMNTRRCALGSNAASPSGITVAGSARVRAAQLTTTGSCNGCASGDVWTDDTRTQRPVTVAGRADPISDPFEPLRSWSPSPPACGPGISYTRNVATLSPGQSICTSVRVGPQETLNLQPGIYYFRNADLDLQGTITGNGVTLIFTGDPDRVGTLRINAQTSGDLRAPTTPLIPGFAASDGLLFYRDARATNNGPQKEVQLNGGASLRLNGGMYFPTSDVVMNGRADVESTCLSLVGFRLSFSGTSDTDLDVSGCQGYAPYPTIRTVRLVE
jgi:hypothetical protein